MTEPNLLAEMIIVGFVGAVSIAFCLTLFIKHHEEKDWAVARTILLGSSISLGVMVIVFEIVWFCLYLGLPV